MIIILFIVNQGKFLIECWDWFVWLIYIRQEDFISNVIPTVREKFSRSFFGIWSGKFKNEWIQSW